MSIARPATPFVPKEGDLFHIRLRQAVQAFHDQVQTNISILNPNLSPGLLIDEYQDYLRKMYGFYIPIEAEFDRYHPSWLHISMEIQRRKKSCLLIQDLLSFGIDPKTVSICKNLPELSEFSKALGCLYVLEGSTLGGQVILKHCQKILQKSIKKNSLGFTFLKGYEENTLFMWKSFQLIMDRYANQNPSDQQKIIDAARETFDRVLKWIGGHSQ